MLQKCAIIGLVLLLAGGAAFWWLYNETQTQRELVRASSISGPTGSAQYIEKYGHWSGLSPDQQPQLLLELDKERKSKSPVQLAREQESRLMADRDKLAAGQLNPGDIAEFLYGRGWENQVELYKKQREQMEFARTICTVCLSIGGILFGGCVAGWLCRLFVRAIRALRQRSSRREVEIEPKAAELVDIEPSEPEEVPEAPQEPPMPKEQPRQRRKVLTRAQESAESGPTASVPGEPAALEEFLTSTTHCTKASGPALAAQAYDEDGGIAVLLTDEQSQEGEWLPEAQWSAQSMVTSPSESTARHERPARRPTFPLSPPMEGDSVVENTLKEQADDLQKQIAEFKQMAQSVQQAAREQSDPVNSTLKELMQQVSAIRDYAATQQNRVERLQDGYDWGIIRTFCLRVIRCIDNIEGRLADLASGDGSASHLEEIKDELLFALESSSIEQFRPDLNSEYHGQEKLAETIKERQPAKKPEQAGRIARVIRPGYRYMIDDENYKVVRAAQVKLFG